MGELYHWHGSSDILNPIQFSLLLNSKRKPNPERGADLTLGQLEFGSVQTNSDLNPHNKTKRKGRAGCTPQSKACNRTLKRPSPRNKNHTKYKYPTCWMEICRILPKHLCTWLAIHNNAAIFTNIRTYAFFYQSMVPSNLWNIRPS